MWDQPNACGRNISKCFSATWGCSCLIRSEERRKRYSIAIGLWHRRQRFGCGRREGGQNIAFAEELRPSGFWLDSQQRRLYDWKLFILNPMKLLVHSRLRRRWRSEEAGCDNGEGQANKEKEQSAAAAFLTNVFEGNAVSPCLDIWVIRKNTDYGSEGKQRRQRQKATEARKLD